MTFAKQPNGLCRGERNKSLSASVLRWLDQVASCPNFQGFFDNFRDLPVHFELMYSEQPRPGPGGAAGVQE